MTNPNLITCLWFDKGEARKAEVDPIRWTVRQQT